MLLACFAVYRGICLVRNLWSALKESKPKRSRISREKLKTKYSKRMVIVHWLTVVLVFAAWFLGNNLGEARLEGHATLAGYIAHSIVGGTVLLLTMLRLSFRSMDGTPPPIGQSLMDIVAKGIHKFLYFLLIALPATGFMTFLTSSVGLALMSGDASLLPAKYTGTGIAPHAVHKILVTVLIVVVVVHVLGAIKHQFFMKDGLMERMSLRRK